MSVTVQEEKKPERSIQERIVIAIRSGTRLAEEEREDIKDSLNETMQEYLPSDWYEIYFETKITKGAIPKC